MSYTITKTNGDSLVTIPDTELNTDYGLYLVGRNYSGYGIYLNDNFVALMENFSKSTAPATPLEGQLWWNNSDNDLQIWSGNVWKKVGHVTASGTAPTASGRNVGDQWWDTTNQQLKAWAGETTVTSPSVYRTTSYEVSVVTATAIRVGDVLTTANILSNAGVTVTQILSTSNVRVGTTASIFPGETVTFTRGSGWNLIGPSYTKDQQLTGIFPRTITDTQSITRVVGLIYQKGSIIGSISRDNEYAPGAADAIERLPIIKPGITLIEDSAPQLVRSVLENTTGSAGNTVIAVTQTEGLAIGDYVITDDIAYSALKTIQEIYANGSIRINATTTLATNDVIVFQRGTSQSNMFHGTVSNAQRLNGITADRFATLDTDQLFLADVSVTGNVGVGQSTVFTDSTVLWQNDRDFNVINTQANGNISLRTVVGLTGGTPVEVLKITGNTGLAEVRGNPISANGVATKSYVDNSQGVALSALTANVTALINGASIGRRDFGNVETVLTTYADNFTTVNNVLDTKANIDGQTFTGVPKVPTAPVGTSNTQIASTAFVTNAVDTSTSAWQANAASQAIELALRATIASPDFSGTPQTTHVANSDRSRRIATTAFVGNIIDAASNAIDNGLTTKAPLNSPIFTGIPSSGYTAVNLSYGVLNTTSSSLNIPVSHPYPTQLATVGFVANVIATMPSANLTPYATKVSPALEGVPTAPTPDEGDNSTKIATTKFVAERSPVLSVNTQTGSVVLTVGDISGAAPLANPTFTGQPQLDADPPVGTSSRWIATTAWVGNITANLAPKNSPTFIGTVTVPNPADNSNTTVAATTAWVKGRIAVADVPLWNGSGKFISIAAPVANDGADGDIWFQYTP
jgi:hypothetical protein